MGTFTWKLSTYNYHNCYFLCKYFCYFRKLVEACDNLCMLDKKDDNVHPKILGKTVCWLVVVNLT